MLHKNDTINKGEKMTKKETLDAVLRLPRKFFDIRTMSIIALLKETGYPEIHDQISVDDIRKALIQCPKCIDEWMAYSDHNRTNSIWGIRNEGTDKYIVFFLDSNNVQSIKEEYTDRFDACAHYIKHDVDDSLTYI
jgi:hypothetical protein